MESAFGKNSMKFGARQKREYLSTLTFSQTLVPPFSSFQRIAFHFFSIGVRSDFCASLEEEEESQK